MAGRPTRQMNRNNGYVSGNLAYDYDYLEREQQRRAERERRDYTERRAPESVPRPQPRRRAAAQPKHRARIRVSPLVLLGFAASAIMLVALLGNYAELTAVSMDVVAMQNELGALETENVALVGRYERTFDLTAIKEAADAAGMAKPSASQIYYIDLSAPDSVVIYPHEEANALGHLFKAFGQCAASALEYFK